MNSDTIVSLQVGNYLMPSGLTSASAIRILELNENGVRFRRCQAYYNAEEFFLTRTALATSNWIPVPINSQLPLL
jgi:hypothetical protein